MISSLADRANEIFDACVARYHVADDVDAPVDAPKFDNPLFDLLYAKCYVDAVQWHLEDIIRVPDIDPREAVALKRRIDASNQTRTDMVEQIDSWFLDRFKDVDVAACASVNTESPAWAIDRLSILALKIWHMREQAARTDAEPALRDKARARLAILLEQREDLTRSINELLADMAAGRKYMKVYRQMKLYNDPATNPALYGRKA